MQSQPSATSSAVRSSRKDGFVRAGLLPFLLLFATGTACGDTLRDALADVAKCADLIDASARLKCFDSAAARAKTALADPRAPRNASTSVFDWFGFTAPVRQPEDFGKAEPDDAKELTEITATVVELARTARGKAMFLLDNGQLWRQIDADITEVRDTPGQAMQVTIEKGLLSSYNLTVAGRRGSVKVNRLK